MLSPQDLQHRSRLLQAIRSFFYDREYIEVETPQRLPVLIPEAHILPFSSEGWLLQTSPELCMKRLLAAGNSRLFQICHCFRKEEVGRFHQSEFTMLEWYRTGWDYHGIMDECEQLIRSVGLAFVHLDGMDRGGFLKRGERLVPLQQPWERMTVERAFELYAPVSLQKAMAGDCFDEVLVESVEPNLGWDRPVFLCEYPRELASLARLHPGNPKVAERFELYICGLELANGFSELVDAVEQRRRFREEIAVIRRAGRDAVMPEKFLGDLQSLGETAGIALGVDRLCMLYMGKERIDDVLSLAETDL